MLYLLHCLVLVTPSVTPKKDCNDIKWKNAECGDTLCVKVGH